MEAAMKNFRLCAFADEADSALSGQIRALKENGISYIELRGVDRKNVSTLTLNEAREIKKRLSGEGISVWSVGSPIGKVGILEPFAPHLDLFHRILEMAGVLGAACIRLFSFYIPKGRDRGEFSAEVLERLSKFCEAAAGSGILLCHENEKAIFGEDPDSCLEIHRALPEMKAVFDPANFVQCGKDTVNAFQMLSPYIHYLHIKDALADGRIVPAGRGEGKIPELLSLYEKLGGGVLTLEPHLAVFDGLKALEREAHSKITYSYPSQRAAFDAACAALKDLLSREDT
jgi:sugar phosphate isomerase/epimerase